MMRGRPAVYATFSSYDEVAHHSGLERADTLEALRKLDQQFGRIERARRYAPRPYEIVVLSDHGQTQGATFKQRNGYGLDELVERSRRAADVAGFAGGDEQSEMVGMAVDEATGRTAGRSGVEEGRLAAGDVVVLGSGNLGLDLPDGGAAPADARGDRRAPPAADPALRVASRTSAGCSSAPPSTARSCSAPRGAHYLDEDRVEGEDPLAALLTQRAAAPAPHRRLPARRRHHGRQLLRPRRSTRAARSRS